MLTVDKSKNISAQKTSEQIGLELQKESHELVNNFLKNIRDSINELKSTNNLLDLNDEKGRSKFFLIRELVHNFEILGQLKSEERTSYSFNNTSATLGALIKFKDLIEVYNNNFAESKQLNLDDPQATFRGLISIKISNLEKSYNEWLVKSESDDTPYKNNLLLAAKQTDRLAYMFFDLREQNRNLLSDIDAGKVTIANTANLALFIEQLKSFNNHSNDKTINSESLHSAYADLNDFKEFLNDFAKSLIVPSFSNRQISDIIIFNKKIAKYLNEDSNKKDSILTIALGHQKELMGDLASLETQQKAISHFKQSLEKLEASVKEIVFKNKAKIYEIHFLGNNDNTQELIKVYPELGEQLKSFKNDFSNNLNTTFSKEVVFLDEVKDRRVTNSNPIVGVEVVATKFSLLIDSFNIARKTLNEIEKAVSPSIDLFARRAKQLANIVKDLFDEAQNYRKEYIKNNKDLTRTLPEATPQNMEERRRIISQDKEFFYSAVPDYVDVEKLFTLSTLKTKFMRFCKATHVKYDSIGREVFKLSESVSLTVRADNQLTFTKIDGKKLRFEHRKDGQVTVYLANPKGEFEKQGTLWMYDAEKLAKRFIEGRSLGIDKNRKRPPATKYIIPDPEKFERNANLCG
jgi:hypothetical protein